MLSGVKGAEEGLTLFKFKRHALVELLCMIDNREG